MLKGFDRRVTHHRLRRALAGLLALAPAVVSAAGGPITVLTATQRREVATVSRAEGEMVAIEDVLAGLGATLTSDPKGGAVTVQRGSHELVLHHKKSLASVDGDLKLLPAPAALEGGRWLVPVDGLARLLAPAPGAARRVAGGAEGSRRRPRLDPEDLGEHVRVGRARPRGVRGERERALPGAAGVRAG